MVNTGSGDARIPLPHPSSMSPAQQAVFDAVVSGPRGTLIGPLRAALYNPELADRWQRLGEILRYRTSLPPRVSELAILVTARRWNSDLEWIVHARAAREAGLPEYTIDAIRLGEPPRLDTDEDACVYAFAREMQMSGIVSSETYDRVLQHWKEVGVVELTAVIGYYTMVSMTLNAHWISLPHSEEARLSSEPSKDHTVLTELPQAAAIPAA
ncbi:carboxymuconolactone decarboxylase family protein [Mesorhizobium sp. A623]